MTAKPSDRPLALVEASTPAVALPSVTFAPPDPVGLFLATLRSPLSRETALVCLRAALRTLGQEPGDLRLVHWWEATVEHLALLDKRVAEEFSPNTQLKIRWAVRGVLEACWRLELIDSDRLKRLTVGWSPVRAERVGKGREITDLEIRKLERYAQSLPPFRGSLVWAVLAAGLGAGLRCAEISSLGLDALSVDGRHLLVMGKGSKQKYQPISSAVGSAIEVWLAERARVPFKCSSLFVLLTETGRVHDQPMTPKATYRLIKQAQRESGCAPLTPHDLRRSYCTYWLRTEDITVAQKLMRHSDPKTTAGYDRREEEELETVVTGKRKEICIETMSRLVKDETSDDP